MSEDLLGFAFEKIMCSPGVNNLSTKFVFTFTLRGEQGVLNKVSAQIIVFGYDSVYMCVYVK